MRVLTNDTKRGWVTTLTQMVSLIRIFVSRAATVLDLMSWAPKGTTVWEQGKTYYFLSYEYDIGFVWVMPRDWRLNPLNFVGWCRAAPLGNYKCWKKYESRNVGLRFFAPNFRLHLPRRMEGGAIKQSKHIFQGLEGGRREGWRIWAILGHFHCWQ